MHDNSLQVEENDIEVIKRITELMQFIVKSLAEQSADSLLGVSPLHYSKQL